MAQSPNNNPYGRRMDLDNIEELARGTTLTDRDSQKAIPFKICLIGNSSVGKTCIVDRYISNEFRADGPPSLSAAFHAKTLDVAPQGVIPTKVKL